MPRVAITDADDPRVAAYRDIRERDLVGRRGRFIAEGEVVLRVLLRQARHRVLSLFLAEKRVAGLTPLLDRLPDGVPVYTASQTVVDTIAGFPLHRGILALGEAAPAPPVDDLLASLHGQALVLGLFGIANHDNMGGIFRNAAAFGADAVILAADCCDPLYRKAIRVSVGAALAVPFARLAATDDANAIFTGHGFATLALSPAGDARLADIRPARRTAALFGAEGPGLPETILAGATLKVGIPMANGFDSLNVATASGIVLHHLRQGSGAT